MELCCKKLRHSIFEKTIYKTIGYCSETVFDRFYQFSKEGFSSNLDIYLSQITQIRGFYGSEFKLTHCKLKTISILINKPLVFMLCSIKQRSFFKSPGMNKLFSISINKLLIIGETERFLLVTSILLLSNKLINCNSLYLKVIFNPSCTRGGGEGWKLLG